MIQRNHPKLSISQQCKLVNLSRSAFYYTLVGIDAATLSMMKQIDRVFTKYPFFHCPAGDCKAICREGAAARSRPTCAGKTLPWDV
ncbi:MAG TPA: hypothetical protein ENK63_03365, partial [Rhodobacterales bacterium]|nr:hypothetical protein [Rhodobacterales bacterium]